MYDPIIIFPDTRGLIFDCDGTLADTMPLHMEAWCETFADYGEECPLKVEPAKCQVFEDGDVGLQAARVAGMMATDVRLYI